MTYDYQHNNVKFCKIREVMFPKCTIQRVKFELEQISFEIIFFYLLIFVSRTGETAILLCKLINMEYVKFCSVKVTKLQRSLFIYLIFFVFKFDILYVFTKNTKTCVHIVDSSHKRNWQSTLIILTHVRIVFAFYNYSLSIILFKG